MGAAGAAVPWDTCSQDGCIGARVGAGDTCLGHTPPDELARSRSFTGAGLDLDGRGVHFKKDTPLAAILESVPTDDEGRRMFGTVRLDQATFDQGVSFDGHTFFGELSATGATFKGNMRFGGTRFGGPVDFAEATFAGQCWFVASHFSGPASFRAARFTEAAWFQQTVFEGPATFDGAVFTTNVVLTSARFSDVGSFSGTSFGAHARFDKATCEGGWRFDGATFHKEGEGPAGVVREAGPPVAPPPPPDPRQRQGAASRPRTARSGPRIGWAVPLAALLIVATGAYVIFRPDNNESFKDFAFVHRNQRTNLPARYNPCQPIRYVVNLDRSPPDFVTALDQAIAEVSGATGITFQSDGNTNEKPRLALPATEDALLAPAPDTRTFRARYQLTMGRSSYQPARWNDRWAPVLISWESFRSANVPFSAPAVSLSDPRDVGNVPVYVSGTVVLNADLPERDLKPTLMHALGHLVGLNHVGTATEIMAPEEEATAWGEGDLEGLRQVGRSAGCLETPPPGP